MMRVKWLLYKATAMVYLLGLLGLAIIIVLATFVVIKPAEAKISKLTAEMIARAADSNDHCFGAKAIIYQGECGYPFGVIEDQYKSIYNNYASTSDLRNTDFYKQSGCWHGREWGDSWRLCSVGNTASDKSILLLGDSHSAHWLGMLNVAGKSLGYKIYDGNGISCGGGLYATSENSYCAENFNKIIEEANNVDLVIMSAAHSMCTPEYCEADKLGAESTIDYFNKRRVPVVLLQDNPVMTGKTGLSTTNCQNNLLCTQPKSDLYTNMNKLYDRLVQDGYGKKFAYLRVEDEFCDETLCYSQIGGIQTHYDAGHINSFYSISMGPWFTEQLKELGL